MALSNNVKAYKRTQTHSFYDLVASQKEKLKEFNKQMEENRERK